MDIARSEKKKHLSWCISAFFYISQTIIKGGISLNNILSYSWMHPTASFNSWKKTLMVIVFHDQFYISPHYIHLYNNYTLCILHYYINILVIQLPKVLMKNMLKASNSTTNATK